MSSCWSDTAVIWWRLTTCPLSVMFVLPVSHIHEAFDAATPSPLSAHTISSVVGLIGAPASRAANVVTGAGPTSGAVSPVLNVNVTFAFAAPAVTYTT